MTTDLEKTKKRADEATKHEKQLEKELDEYKTKLSIANAEIDTAFQASRNHALELSKYKHLNEQMSEQLELVQKDKRRISGKLLCLTFIDTNSNKKPKFLKLTFDKISRRTRINEQSLDGGSK